MIKWKNVAKVVDRGRQHLAHLKEKGSIIYATLCNGCLLQSSDHTLLHEELAKGPSGRMAQGCLTEHFGLSIGLHNGVQ